jgi:hypothetical protein
MRIEGEIFRPQMLSRLAVSKVVEQDRAQNRALSLHVCGQSVRQAVIGGSHGKLSFQEKITRESTAILSAMQLWMGANLFGKQAKNLLLFGDLRASSVGRVIQVPKYRRTKYELQELSHTKHQQNKMRPRPATGAALLVRCPSLPSHRNPRKAASSKLRFATLVSQHLAQRNSRAELGITFAAIASTDGSSPLVERTF